MNLKISSALVILSIAIHPLFASAAKLLPTTEKPLHSEDDAAWAMCVVAPFFIGYVIDALNINSSGDVDKRIFTHVGQKKQLMVKDGDHILVRSWFGWDIAVFQAAGGSNVDKPNAQIPHSGGIKCFGTTLSAYCQIISKEECLGMPYASNQQFIFVRNDSDNGATEDENLLEAKNETLDHKAIVNPHGECQQLPVNTHDTVSVGLFGDDTSFISYTVGDKTNEVSVGHGISCTTKPGSKPVCHIASRGDSCKKPK